MNIRNRSYSIGALVDIPAPGAQGGVIFAHGSWFGGHALYVKDNRLHYAYNFVGMFEQKVDAIEDLPTGENLILSASFDKTVKIRLVSPATSCPSSTGTARSARAASSSTIKQVAIDVSGEPYLDLERQAAAMLARE